MNYKKTLLIAITASLLGFSTAQANDGAIYQITSVKGKALIQSPQGKRQLAKVGMRVANGSEIIVLKNSVVNGFDIQNKCEIEYQELVRTQLYRGKMCKAAAVAHSAPKPAYGPKPVAPTGGGSVGYGGGYLPLALGIGGLLLLASSDDDEPASP